MVMAEVEFATFDSGSGIQHKLLGDCAAACWENGVGAFVAQVSADALSARATGLLRSADESAVRKVAASFADEVVVGGQAWADVLR
jgi:hypothetical protein